MENHESQISSSDEDCALLNNETSKSLDENSFSSNVLTISKVINGKEFRDDEDTRSELNFDRDLETKEEREKRKSIEQAIANKYSTLKNWKHLAISKYGLVGDDLRRKIWPLLLEINPDPDEVIPSLEELSCHPEYQQVVLDVNRSLKRFPPGIPYNQRVALQDQLTVLILRVIIKYPHLRYYQGYHDVAVTFLLVVGEAVAFRIMEKLSTDHLRECMEPTMEKTSYRLDYIYALLYKVDRDLHDFMDRASVGTMFALPWYLTWFGHSLNQYKDVVRLYDYFLASAQLMPIYVATSLVIHRRNEVFAEECDMASLHCILSQIPDNLNFESILEHAEKYYKDYPPNKLEKLAKQRVQREADRRRLVESIMRNRINKSQSIWGRIPFWLVHRSKYGLIFAAATVILGYIFYIKYSEWSLRRIFNV